MNTPPALKLHACTVDNCNKKFKTKFALKRHMLTHTKVKNYKCLYCDKTFSLPQYAREHQYLHTNEKPFVCGVNGCTASFRQAGKVAIHRKSHPEYACKSYDYSLNGKNTTGLKKRLEKERIREEKLALRLKRPVFRVLHHQTLIRRALKEKEKEKEKEMEILNASLPKSSSNSEITAHLIDVDLIPKVMKIIQKEEMKKQQEKKEDEIQVKATEVPDEIENELLLNELVEIQKAHQDKLETLLKGRENPFQIVKKTIPSVQFQNANTNSNQIDSQKEDRKEQIINQDPINQFGGNINEDLNPTKADNQFLPSIEQNDKNSLKESQNISVLQNTINPNSRAINISQTISIANHDLIQVKLEPGLHRNSHEEPIIPSSQNLNHQTVLQNYANALYAGIQSQNALLNLSNASYLYQLLLFNPAYLNNLNVNILLSLLNRSLLTLQAYRRENLAMTQTQYLQTLINWYSQAILNQQQPPSQSE